jgi:hypothetical protein
LPYQYAVSPSDNAGRFKALFDEKYIYFLFDVTDNCKNRIGIMTTDKCWIENADNGMVVWKISGDTTQGGLSCSERKKISLPAGHYLLKATSDKGHSYERWYGKPPSNGIYGVRLYMADPFPDTTILYEKK